jgi:integrase
VKGSVRKPRTQGGTWSYRLDLGLDAGGRREQKQVGGFRTKREAQAALNEALAGLQRGTYVAPSRRTIGAFLELWIDGARSELALTAWVNYDDTIRRYIAPHLGSKRLVDLSPLDVKAWHAALLDHGRSDGGALAAASVQLAHRVLHRALADAVRWKLIATNPASGTRAPRGERKEMKTWTAAEATTFLDGIAGDRLAALWTLALHTGLRRGELAGLRWKDVDVEGGTLTVAQQRTNANHEIVVSTPKGKSQRQLLLAPATVAVLRLHRAVQLRERLALGEAWTDTGYVFVDEAGQPYHPGRFLPMFHVACDRAHVPKIRLHDVRHTMATLALQAGIHPKVVQEQLGHSAIGVTMDVYSHVPQAVRRESASRIAGLFANRD